MNGLIDYKQKNELGRRAYNCLTMGLVAAGFFVIAVIYQMASDNIIESYVGVDYILFVIALCVISIVSIIVMAIGKSIQNPVISGIAYAVFCVSIGIPVAFALTACELPVITSAFFITFGLSVVFTIAGFVFPDFFSKITRICFTVLIAIIVSEIIFMILGISQTVTDYVVIIIFCCLLGFDAYAMANDEPTTSNAFYHASQIFLDLMNIFIRVLSIIKGSDNN